MERVDEQALNLLSRQVIGCAMEVLNDLGAGFLEKVYERALVRELSLKGLQVRSQVGLEVRYKGACVGEYSADLVVQNMLIVELKCVRSLREEHLAQCLNYLAATGHKLCLLLNFQNSRLEWRRVVRGL